MYFTLQGQLNSHIPPDYLAQLTQRISSLVDKCFPASVKPINSLLPRGTLSLLRKDSTTSGLTFVYSISPEASCLVYVFVSLARCLAGSLATKFLLLRSPVYTITKYQQNAKLIYTWSKWKRTNRKHATIYGIFFRKVRT